MWNIQCGLKNMAELLKIVNCWTKYEANNEANDCCATEVRIWKKRKENNEKNCKYDLQLNV